jgi:hypothetical protein
MRLTAYDADRLARALEGLTKVALDCEVRFDAYQPIDLVVTNGTNVRVRWDEDQGSRGEYVVDDVNGS